MVALSTMNVSRALLSEEARRKAMGSSHHGEAHYVQKEGKQRRGRSRNHDNDKSGKKNDAKSRGRSKSCGSLKDVQCHHCKKYGHLKKDCYAWKREKGKGKEKTVTHTVHAIEDKPKSLVHIQEINVVTDDCDAQDLNVLTKIVDTSLDAQDALCLESTLSAEVLVSGELSHTWILDSGASLHVTPHCEWFTRYEETVGSVTLGDSFRCDIVGIGDIALVLLNGVCFVLENVRHVPCLTHNLISVGRLDDLGYKVTIHQQSWRIAKGNLVIASGSKMGSLYPLLFSCKNSVLAVTELPSVALWHSRLGHMSKKGMETLSRLGYLPSLLFSDFPFCEHCQYGKQTRQST